MLRDVDPVGGSARPVADVVEAATDVLEVTLAEEAVCTA